MHDYEFRPCRPEEAAEVFRLIRERTRWMDEVGIRQWNHTDYLNVFPRSYYEIQQAEGALYANKVMLVCPKCGKPTRVATKVYGDGTKERVCKHKDCGETF